MLINSDGVAPSCIVGVFASVIFPGARKDNRGRHTIKSRRFLLVLAYPGNGRQSEKKGHKMVASVCL